MPLLQADVDNGVSDMIGCLDYGVAVESFPAWAASGTAILGTAGSVYGTAIQVRRTITVTSLLAHVTTAGGTLTAGDSWGLLYSSAGTLLGQSTDQATPWATAGLSTMALTAKATGSLTLSPGLYWGAVVSTGTTLPTFAKAGAPQALFNAGLAVGISRCGILATSITTTPAAITPGSIAQANSQPYWFGLI
jgi:hypothetical protein